MAGFTHSFPELGVSDLRKALDYYTGPMGFELDWQAGAHTASVSNGDISVFLRSIESGGLGPSRTILNIENADVVYDTWRALGVIIIEPIAARTWGMREFVASDLDGNEFRIGHIDESGADYREFKS